MIPETLNHTCPEVREMSDERKAYLQMCIQRLTDTKKAQIFIAKLNKIHKRLLHATEDIPDEELQLYVKYVFDNIYNIEQLDNMM